MRKETTLKEYIDTYGLTKDKIMAVINKNRSFYDKYIQWGDNDDKTIIEPKALDMLGTVFNEDNSGTVNDMHGLVPMPGLEKIESFYKNDDKSVVNSVDKPLIDTNGKTDSDSISMKDYMNIPEKSKEIKAKKPRAPRKKKSKYNLSFADYENNKCEISNIKILRDFLMNDGKHKVEDIAIMSDEEVKVEFNKQYICIGESPSYIIYSKSVLKAIVSDIYIIPNG